MCVPDVIRNRTTGGTEPLVEQNHGWNRTTRGTEPWVLVLGLVTFLETLWIPSLSKRRVQFPSLCPSMVYNPQQDCEGVSLTLLSAP